MYVYNELPRLSTQRNYSFFAISNLCCSLSRPCETSVRLFRYFWGLLRVDSRIFAPKYAETSIIRYIYRITPFSVSPRRSLIHFGKDFLLSNKIGVSRFTLPSLSKKWKNETIFVFFSWRGCFFFFLFSLFFSKSNAIVQRVCLYRKTYRKFTFI